MRKVFSLPDLGASALEAARTSLSGAVTVAGQLGDGVGPVLLESARVAFAQSMSVVSAVSVAIVLAAAAMNLLLARRQS